MACREEDRETRIDGVPDSYNPWLHLTLTVGSGLSVLAVALWFVTDLHWPDFRRQHLYAAISAYQQRHRRFGGA